MSPLINKPATMSRRSGVPTTKKPLGPTDNPAWLAIGTDVSAKFKGAYCESKIKELLSKLIEIRAQPLKDKTIPEDHVYTHEEVQGKLEVGSIVQVSYKKIFVEARVTHVRDLTQYRIVFNDGDERIVKRNQMLLKGEKHYDSQSNLDNLPLLNPDALKAKLASAEEPIFMGGSRSATRQLKAIMDVGQQRERHSEKLSAWSSLSDLSDSSDEEASKLKVDDEGPSTSKKAKKAELELQPKKKGKFGRSLSPKNDFAEGKAVIGRAKPLDTNKITLYFGVVIAKTVYAATTGERSKSLAENEIPVRCLPKGDIRVFKLNQLAIYDENKLSLDSLSNKMRESCEVLLRYKNKGRLPTGWTDESIHGAPPQTPKKGRKSKRQLSKNTPRREKFYRHLQAYYKDIIDLNFPKLNPTTKDGVELDMCRLFFTVRQEGGYRAASYSNKWQKIVQKLKWSDYMTGDELRDLYHNRLETFEYFQERMSDRKLAKPSSEHLRASAKVARHSHGSTPTPSIADRGIRTTPKKSQTPAAVERKRKAQPASVPKKQRRGSVSSPDLEEKPGAVASRKGSSSSPHPSQKVRVMSPTELDANDGYVAADIFSQIVETKIIRAAHRTKFYSARVVDARRAPIEVILRVLTKLEPVVGTSNNYKFQNKLHRDALIELGRLTKAFVHYCGWNNRFDEWVSIDRIKVSPETKRLSMLNLIRTYSFSPNLLDAIHNFFKRRRITRERYKARRHATNSDDAADEDESKKLGDKRKEGSQTDGPPAIITLYSELQTFLYDDEGLKIPQALPEKIEKDEYDQISNSELAAMNAMLSDAEPDDDLTATPTSSKRLLKRKRAKLGNEAKEVLSKPVKEKPTVEAKKDPEEVVEKKKKVVEDKPTAKQQKQKDEPKPPQKLNESPKQQKLTLKEAKEIKETNEAKEESSKPQKAALKEIKETNEAREVKEEPPKPQKSTVKESKESPAKVTAQKEKKEEKPKEKPVTRSETPIKKQKVDPNINRPLDFMSGITNVEEKRGRSSPTKGMKAQKSEEIVPAAIETTVVAATIPTQAATTKTKTPQTPVVQPEAVQPVPDLPSPTSQRQTPSRRGAKLAERQASSSSTTMSSPKPPTQQPVIQKEVAKEEAVMSEDFKAFSPITPTSTTIESNVDVTTTVTESVNVTRENQFSPRSCFLQALAQQPQPIWRIPNPHQSDAELAAEFEVHENQNQITLDTLRHIPPALLASQLNIPLTSAALINQEHLKSTVQSAAIPSIQQQAFAAAKPITQPSISANTSTPQQVFSPQTSIPTSKQFNPQLTQQSMATFNSIQNAIGSQLPLNPQLLSLLQTVQQQQNAFQQSSFVQQKAAQFPSPSNFQHQMATSQVGTSASISQTQLKDIKPQMSSASLQQANLMAANKQVPSVELDQTPAMKCLTEFVLLHQYLCIDQTTQDTLDALRRSFSLSRYDSLRMIRPQYTNVINRIAELDTKCNEYTDPVMRPLAESFVSNKVGAAIRTPGGLASMLQQFVHPAIYAQMVSQPSPSQVAPLSLPQLQLLLGQRQQQIQQQQFRQTTIPTPNFLNEQLLAQQQAQLAQHNTADQIHARLQALLMSMQNGGQPTTTDRAYISPPNDPRPSMSATLGQPTPQANTSSSGAYNHCASNPIQPIRHENKLIHVPGVYSASKKPSNWNTSENCKNEVRMQTESTQMLTQALSASEQATLNVAIGKESQRAECSHAWPLKQTTKIIAAVDQKPCEDCGSNPRVVEMHLLNKMPFHLRTQILDNFAKANRMSKERRNRPQCKVKNLSRQAQKQKIERRRNEEMLEELRNGNGSDFMLIDERFSNTHNPVEPPLLYEIFSSLGYDIFATDRLPESEDIKQKSEVSVKEMTKEQVRENVLKLIKESGAKPSTTNFDNLEDLNKYIQTLSNIAEQNQVRLGLANYNLELTNEISSTVVNFQNTIAEEQRKFEAHEESTMASAAVVNKNKPKYLLHRGRKGYY